MRFSDSFLEEIRDRVPIADVVGRRVTFDRKKSNQAKGDFWGCCPFHGEKSPSFHCENTKGRYYCFGCGASGDHFRFLTELDGLSFPEAVERIADEAGVAMPAVDPQAMEKEKKKASLYEVMELAVQFFRDQLQSAEGANARAYLRDRGLPIAVQNEFGLGYAPSSRSALKEYLGAKGIEREKIEACGLVVHGPEISVSYDRFRDRIMFPILDAKSRPIAFGGRALSADVLAKYLNSPETELFSKSNVLYNYARARSSTAKSDSLLIVEGYMDVIALHSAGIKTAVAPLGTALTNNQIQLAWRVGGEPILCFDGDEAGVRAANRTVDMILPDLDVDKTIKITLLPHGKDPDDVVNESGAKGFKLLIGNAMPLSEFIIERHLESMSWETPEGKAKVERVINRDIYSIKDKTLLHHFRAHARLRLSERFYRKGQVQPLVKVGLQTWPIFREKITLGLCVEYPYLLAEYVEEICRLKFRTTKYQRFADELRKLYGEFAELSVSDVYDKIHPVFYDVLEEVHGREDNFELPCLSGEGMFRWSSERGHRLKRLFPVLKYGPPRNIVEKTMELLLMQFTYTDFSEELEEFEVEDELESYLRKLEDFRVFEASMHLFESRLDDEYRVLAGKPVLSATADA